MNQVEVLTKIVCGPVMDATHIDQSESRLVLCDFDLCHFMSLYDPLRWMLNATWNIKWIVKRNAEILKLVVKRNDQYSLNRTASC